MASLRMTGSIMSGPLPVGPILVLGAGRQPRRSLRPPLRRCLLTSVAASHAPGSAGRTEPHLVTSPGAIRPGDFDLILACRADVCKAWVAEPGVFSRILAAFSSPRRIVSWSPTRAERSRAGEQLRFGSPGACLLNRTRGPFGGRSERHDLTPRRGLA
jgi:hypothetical protein